MKSIEMAGEANFIFSQAWNKQIIPWNPWK